MSDRVSIELLKAGMRIADPPGTYLLSMFPKRRKFLGFLPGQLFGEFIQIGTIRLFFKICPDGIAGPRFVRIVKLL